VNPIYDLTLAVQTLIENEFSVVADRPEILWGDVELLRATGVIVNNMANSNVVCIQFQDAQNDGPVQFPILLQGRGNFIVQCMNNTFLDPANREAGACAVALRIITALMTHNLIYTQGFYLADYRHITLFEMGGDHFVGLQLTFGFNWLVKIT